MTLINLQNYDKSFQRKVLGALLTDKKFLLNVRDVLKEDYWDGQVDKWIIRQILQYWDNYRCTITLAVLKVELQKVENETLKIAIREELRNSYEASQEDLEYVENEFTEFCRNQEMKTAIINSTDLLKTNDFEGIRKLIENALKAGMEKSIGLEYKKDIEIRYRDDYRPTVPTPWKEINMVYEGGLGPGDLFLICGGPGAGKTWIAMAMAVYAAQLGYNVNYYTLELSESYVGRRLDSYLTGYSVKECADHREEVETALKDLKGNLTVKEYAPKTATLSTIEAHIQKCVDEDLKPDIVFIDYLDYVKSVHSRYTDRKDEVDDVYIGAKSLAKRLNIPVVSPSQVNRTGAKSEIVEGDSIAGSYDKLAVADGVISLSRKKEDKVAGTARIHIMKSRYGGDGTTYSVKMDAANGHIEFEDEILPDDLDSGSDRSHVNPELMKSFFGKQ